MSLNEVVALTELGHGIVQITMQDRAGKNTFSPGIIRGLVAAFAQINQNQHYKAVIITGYDSYFASGGTQEALLQISEGKAKFSDQDLYSLALNCPIPVIAAMQGHAIGGGFVMGLFADVIILSRESIYTTNFMKYGFTPGMGATCVVPQKLGLVLAQEMLLSAKNYRGEELESRGVPFSVLPRDQVLPAAIDLAKEIADKPRFSLVTLKDHLVASLREQLAQAVEQELRMHDLTFHQPEVKDRIRALFSR